jgi:hypothetical protein
LALVLNVPAALVARNLIQAITLGIIWSARKCVFMSAAHGHFLHRNAICRRAKYGARSAAATSTI